ncbi:MAG: GNAT family N-acetyltransferase [Gemmataceae bacterium]
MADSFQTSNLVPTGSAIVTHIKRIRMAVSLNGVPPAEMAATPAFLPWSSNLLALHSDALFHSFRNEPDTALFPSFGTETGCRDFMHALQSLDQFCPESTWLAMDANRAIGTIQGLIMPNNEGEIQNLSVLASERGKGIGSGLLMHGLEGFRRAGCSRVVLEVSASNLPAIRLYRKFGFSSYKTVYLPTYGSLPSLGLDI